MFTASIFRSSVARSLVQLQELCIKDCGKVKTLIENHSSRGERVNAEHQNSDGSLFPELKSLKIEGCGQLRWVLPVLSAGDLRLLQTLSVSSCEKLEYIFGEEGVDAEHQNSDGSLFPELKSLKIQRCGQLKFVLSVLSAGDLRVLQELSVSSCEKLEYIFGEYRDDGQALPKNMLPSLTKMELETGPSFINICKAFNKSVQRASHGCCCLPSHSSESMKRNETSHPADQRPLRQSWSLQNKREMTPMEWPALKHINLGKELVKSPFPRSMVCLYGRQPMLEIGDQEPIRRPCPDLMVCLRGRQPNLETWMDPMKLLMVMQELRRLGIRHSEIGEIFNLEGIMSEEPVKLKLQVLDIQGLPNLKCIYKDPNKILNLCNLKELAFSKCDQLTAIFSTSTMKSLSQLSRLAVTQCNGLVCVIKDDGGSHQLSPLKLREISISHCKNLKSLFSISKFSRLEELTSLEIEEASSLKEVFGQGDAQERGLEDVFPNLSHLKLKNLRELERFCGGIDVQSVKKFDSEFEVVECGLWEKPIDQSVRNELIEEPQSTDSNTGQALPHASYEGSSSLVHSHLDEEAERKQENETQGKMGDFPKMEEEIEEVTRKTGEEVAFSETSAMTNEATMKTQANGPTPALERKESQISPAESKMRSKSLQTVNQRIPEETIFMKQKVIPSSINSQEWDSQSSQSTLSKEKTKKTQANGPTPTLKKKASETSPAESKMKSTSSHSNEAMPNGRVQGDLTSKDDMVATPIADNKPPRNSLGTMATPQRTKEEKMKTQANSPTPALERKSSQISPAESKMRSTSLQSNVAIPNERVQEGPTSKDDAPSDSVATLVTPPQSKEETKKTQANGPTPTLEKKAPETSPAESKMKSTSLHSNEAIPNGRVQGDLTAKDDMVATPIADNKPPRNSLGTMVTPQRAELVKAPKENISHVIPSYHQAGPSSQILGIGEILEATELKDGEPALLAKALELYPQLRLPREQRPRPIIAFSYRVLIKILLMLSTKSPSTVTASEKLTLKTNLDAARYFGFDKDWIDSVRAKWFGNDMFDVLGREEILVKKAKLETYSATLEKVQNQRKEAMERVAGARKHLDLVQSELEAIDSQLFGRLEERKKLIIHMMQFREIIKTKYRPFGIY